MKKEYAVECVTYYRLTVNGKTELYEQMVELDNGCVKLLKAGKWSLLNPYGKFICTSEVLEVYETKDGMSRIFDGSRYSYLNVETSNIWPFMFENAGDFESGIAKVVFNGKECYICKEGKFVD